MGKTLTLPEHGDIILNTMSQKRKKWVSLVFVLSRVDFWVIWKWHGIPCCCFKFLFRNNCKREQLDEKAIRHCCGNLFESFIPKVQSLFSKITGYLENGIWKTPYSWRFYGSTYVSRLLLEEYCTKAFNLIIACFFTFHTSQAFQFVFVGTYVSRIRG